MSVTLPAVGRPFGRFRYRIGQGLGYLIDRSRPDVDTRLGGLLTPSQWELVAGLTTRDRSHLLDVHQRLKSEGCADPDLLLAALLHDCGKIDERARAGVSHRTLLVLLQPRFTGLLQRLASASDGGWRHGLYLAIEHPRLGASRARRAGCSERVCWLIEHHHDAAEDGDDGLRMLQLADDKS